MDGSISEVICGNLLKRSFTKSSSTTTYKSISDSLSPSSLPSDPERKIAFTRFSEARIF